MMVVESNGDVLTTCHLYIPVTVKPTVKKGPRGKKSCVYVRDVLTLVFQSRWKEHAQYSLRSSIIFLVYLTYKLYQNYLH